MMIIYSLSMQELYGHFPCLSLHILVSVVRSTTSDWKRLPQPIVVSDSVETLKANVSSVKY